MSVKIVVKLMLNANLIEEKAVKTWEKEAPYVSVLSLSAYEHLPYWPLDIFY